MNLYWSWSPEGTPLRLYGEIEGYYPEPLAGGSLDAAPLQSLVWQPAPPVPAPAGQVMTSWRAPSTERHPALPLPLPVSDDRLVSVPAQPISSQLFNQLSGLARTPQARIIPPGGGLAVAGSAPTTGVYSGLSSSNEEEMTAGGGCTG